MADIIIRNLEPVVLQKIDELAKKKKISREEYLRRYLTKVSELEDVVQLDEKYSSLLIFFFFANSSIFCSTTGSKFLIIISAIEKTSYLGGHI